MDGAFAELRLKARTTRTNFGDMTKNYFRCSNLPNPGSPIPYLVSSEVGEQLPASLCRFDGRPYEPYERADSGNVR